MSQWHAASQIINDVRASYTESNRLFTEYGLADAYGDIDRVVDTIRTLPPTPAATLEVNYRNWAPLAHWNQYKQVYTVHPSLTREMKATDFDTSVPGPVLRQLPHPDPMFVFPEGIPVVLTDGKPGRLTALIVTGANVSGPGYANFTSSTNPKINGLMLTSIAEVLSPTGKVIDWDYCFTSVPVTETFTIAGLINDVRGHTMTMGDGVRRQGLQDERVRTYVRQVVAIGIAHLLYATSRSADVGEPRQTTSRQSDMSRKIKAAKPKPVKTMPMGFKIGPALDAARRKLDRGVGRSEPGTGTKSPHVRKAHFHTFRHGPGRQLFYVDWLPPIPVKMDGPIKVPTIHAYEDPE